MRKFVNIALFFAILLSVYLWQTNWAVAIVLVTLALIIYLFFNLYGSLYLSSSYFINAFTKPISGNEKTAVLTFDDGPHEQTSEILNVLENHNCKGSFFIIGKNALSNPDIVKQIDTAGHVIGNHSFWHRPNFPIQFSTYIQTELKNTNTLIEKTIGKKPRFFRPPFGALSPVVAHAIKKLGMDVIGWNVRSFDTKNNQEKTLKRVKAKTQNKANVIILLHDSTENIAALLDSIIIYLKENNYKIIPLADAIKQAPYEDI